MNSSEKLYKRLGWLIALMACCGALTGCGGGIYGTGSGTDTEISETVTSGGINEPAGSESQPDTAGSGDSQDIGSDALPGDLPSQQQAFSNTLSSGLAIPPQLKLINLSEAPVSAYVNDSATVLFDAAASPQSTSRYSTLMPGESVITVFNADTEATIGRIDPLNVAGGSVTSLVIADNLSHSASLPGILPLSTRVTSAAADMAMVRLVTTADTTSARIPVYTLMPQGTHPGMAEISFAGIDITSQRASDYQLAGAGDYELTDGDGRAIAGALRFSPGMVYTLIITDATDSGIYLEVDRVP